MAAITPEMCVGGREYSEPRLRSDGAVVVYASADEGIACLVVHSLDDDTPDRLLATEPALRAARGLGGGDAVPSEVLPSLRRIHHPEREVARTERVGLRFLE